MAYMAVRVAEAKGGDVEYIASLPLDDLKDLTPGQQKAALVAAVKAVRDAQRGGPADLPGISGTVTV